MTPSRPTTGSNTTQPRLAPCAVEGGVDVAGAAAVGQTVGVRVAAVMAANGARERRARGDGERAERGAVVGGVEREDAGAAGCEQRGLERDLDRVRARHREVDARIGHRREGAQPPRQLDARGCAATSPRPCTRGRACSRDRRHHARMAMADRGDAEPRREVEVAVAVDVEDVRAERLRPHHAGTGRRRC